MPASRMISPAHLPERRRDSRQAFYETIAVMHPGGSASTASSKDMSRSGVEFTFDSEIPKESELELLIPADSHILRCRGKVVRTEPDPRTGSFKIAVAFSRTEPAERPKVQMPLAA